MAPALAEVSPGFAPQAERVLHRTPNMITLPGLGEPDFHCSYAVRSLRQVGFSAHSGLVWDLGFAQPSLAYLNQRAQHVYHRHGDLPLSLNGHSFGSLLGRAIALDHPEMVERLISIGGPDPEHLGESVHPVMKAASGAGNRMQPGMREFVERLAKAQLADHIEDHRIVSSGDKVVPMPDEFTMRRLAKEKGVTFYVLSGGHISQMRSDGVISTVMGIVTGNEDFYPPNLKIISSQ